MLKVETVKLKEWFAVDPGLRAVARRSGTAGRRPVRAGDRTIGAVVRMDERGAW